MAKKYMVRCDIEGASGVVSYKQAEPGNCEYVFGKKMFESDLTSLLDGLNDGGAGSVFLYDEHYHGRNIDVDILPENSFAICGKPPYRKDWAGGLDKTFDGLILLGFHSKRGTKNGLLGHTYEPDIGNIRLNGTSVGEIGIETAIAGDHDVPLLLITGDSAAIREAEELVPGIASVVVKESITNNGAVCYPAKVTSKLIYENASFVVKKPPIVKPYNLGNDVCLEISLISGEYFSNFIRIFGENMIDETTVAVKGESATEVWSKYWEMKLKCFREMGLNNL